MHRVSRTAPMEAALPRWVNRVTLVVQSLKLYMLAANKSQRPGSPLSSCDPRSENFRPAPATKSVTTLDTRTSPGPHCPMTRAAACTAMPPISSPRISTSPVCNPARSGNPICLAAAPNAKAERTARPGPSNVARIPSPVWRVSPWETLELHALRGMPGGPRGSRSRQ
jgi:hypothetical protein